jgi:23S rRNA (pseudouridine1915-N3)-methyltransferase
VRITIVCVGRVRGAPFADDVAHYTRLLERRVALDVVEVRGGGTEAARSGQALEREADAITKRIPASAFVCALDRESGQRASTELARFLEDRRASGRDLCFVVGGPFGLHERVLAGADELLSLGRLTLPHELARVVLLEQLFRAHKILAGEPYHY